MTEVKTRKNARSNLYLVQTSTGYWASYDARDNIKTIIGRDEAEAKIAFQKMLHPEREWRQSCYPDLAKLVDETIDQKEGKTPKPKSEPKPQEPKRAYRRAIDKLSDPPIAEILTGVEYRAFGSNNKYFKNDQPFAVIEELTRVTSKSAAKRLLKEAWNLGMIPGIRPKGPKA